MNYLLRQDKLKKLLETKSLDAFLVKKKQNLSYLTGTKGEDAVLFLSGSRSFLITDSRYKEEYARTAKNCQLVIAKWSEINACIGSLIKRKGAGRIGFESNSFSYSEYTDLKKGLINKRLVPVKELIESLRMVKDNNEARCIRVACKYGCETMRYGINSLKAYTSEAKVKNRIELYMIKNGLKGADFEIIVASGRNAAMPHASCTTKAIRQGEMVIIDLGIINYGYNSDLTRTAFLGRIDHDKYLRIYNVVLSAQKKAIEHIKPGVPARYIDYIARRYITEKGLGKYFIHGLGHGIGLEAHERPCISKNSNEMLQKDMMMTIEPGIYIPKWGGVRIEDVVIVTGDSCEVLTDSC